MTSALTETPSRLDTSEQVRHTDGPWSYSLSAKGRKYHINAESWMQFARVWAGTEGTKHYDAEAKANARLIAAAPELLSACQSVWACLAGHSNPEISAVADQCRAAIEKAQGW